MDANLIVQIIGLLIGGGLGAGLMQLYTARISKQKLVVETASAEEDVNRKKQDNKQDAFDTMYQQLNKCLLDYTTLSDDYRKFRENAREKEEYFEDKVSKKREELAILKSKVAYLKGIRCYDTLCPRRKLDPDKIDQHLKNTFAEADNSETK